MSTRRATDRRTPSSVTVPSLGVALALLMVTVTGLTAASATSGPSVPSYTPPAASVWAYGAVDHHAFSREFRSLLGVEFSYTVSITYGFAVVLNETEPLPGEYVVNASRAMGSSIVITYCQPNCSAPNATGTISHRSWESVNASATLLNSGTVYVSGTAVPALALNRSTLAVNAGIQETTAYVRGIVLEREHNLTATLSGTDALSFSPSLGLLPLNLSSGEEWNSSATYLQVGMYNWTLDYESQGALVSAHAPVILHGSGSLNGTGSVAVAGADSGSSVSFGGAAYDAVNLSVSGPFSLREGWILLPSSADAFGGSAPAWSTYESSYSNSTQSSVEVEPHLVSGSHLGFGGSGEWWSTLSANPTLALVAGVSAGPAAAPAVPAESNATFVQGSPESPAQATAQQQCLTSGVNCNFGPAAPRGWFGPLVVAGVVVVAAAAVTLAVVGQRRKIPPTAFPNAGLYPPGPAGAVRPTAPSPPPARPTPPSTDDDDPLGHLW